jgi:hypothetical protein
VRREEHIRRSPCPRWSRETGRCFARRRAGPAGQRARGNISSEKSNRHEKVAANQAGNSGRNQGTRQSQRSSHGKEAVSSATLGAGAAIARGCTVWIVAAVWLWRAAARGAGERARWGGACEVSPPIDMAIVLSEMASAKETGENSAAKCSAKGNWAALRWMTDAGARGCRHQ